MDVDAQGDGDNSVVLVVFFVRERFATRRCQKHKIVNVIFGRVRLRVPWSEMFSVGELRHFAQRITALLDTEEDIALSCDSLVRSAASSRTASPFSMPREPLQATSEAMGASRIIMT